MNESAKTITFVGAAVVTAAIAIGSHFMNRPTNSADFELVGQPFYESFDSASQAQSLEVVAMDPETARLRRFSVENQDGLWRIPSHYNYPAEAAERLATTATSVMGIEREILAGRLAKEHERLGVVDPLDEEVEDPEAAGKRLTLKDAQGEVVADYIIGKEAGEVVLSESERPFGNRNNEKYYYVRAPEENQTYKVALNIDLSTKFSDWIDPDLLRLEGTELTRIDINNYSIEEEETNALSGTRRLYKKEGDVINISRPATTDPWALEGLNPAVEELNDARIREVVSVLDELKIAGVRPKFKFKDKLLLTADLQLNKQPEFEADPQGFARAIDRLQSELDDRGFNLAQAGEKLELVSRFGELAVGTENGVVYTLHIGSKVEGDEKEIEIGSSGSDSEKPQVESDEEKTGEEEKPDGKTDEQASDDAADEASDKEEAEEIDNRYLLVRVSLDKSLIKPQPVKPTEPVEPVAPEGYTPKPEEPEQKEGEEKKDSPEDVAAPEGVEKPEGEQEKVDDRKPEFIQHDEALKKYEEDKVRYGLDLTRFENDTKTFDKKVEDSQKIVDELNERFGDWYYVMTGDNLKTLRTARADLVTKIEPPEGSKPPEAGRPDISFPELPNMKPGQPNGNPDAPENPAEAEGKPVEVEGKPNNAGAGDSKTDVMPAKTETKPVDAESKPAEPAGEAGKGDGKVGETPMAEETTEAVKGEAQKAEPVKGEENSSETKPGGENK